MIPIVIHQLFNYFLASQAEDILQILVITAVFYLIVAVIIVLVNYKKFLSSRLNESHGLDERME